MLKNFLSAILLFSLFLTGTMAFAAPQLTVCIVAGDIKKNPKYYSLPTTKTRLKCEVGNAQYRPTLRDLYRNGWRLIDMQQVDPREAKNKKFPSPLLYLERDLSKEPVRNKPQPKKEPEPSSGFPNFFESL